MRVSREFERVDEGTSFKETVERVRVLVNRLLERAGECAGVLRAVIASDEWFAYDEIEVVIEASDDEKGKCNRAKFRRSNFFGIVVRSRSGDGEDVELWRMSPLELYSKDVK